MKLVELGSPCPKPRPASTRATAPEATASAKPRIHGFCEEDSWETFALARYRAYTTNGFGMRLCNSEPDLLHRRPSVDGSAPRQHRRSSTMPKNASQPWVRAGEHKPERQMAATASQKSIEG